MLVNIIYLQLIECCFFVKQKTAYDMRISDWSSDVCSSDLAPQSANTSWQYQSWGNTRAPESRITGNLEPARGPSLPGDLLLIERSIDDGLLFRLTVISQTGPLFALVQPRTGGPRLVLLAGGPLPVRSEGRRVGKECVRSGRKRRSP